MTSKARVVLQDAKHAISMHSNPLQAESFRVSWISVVTLLRAVGHVLAKVDAPSDPLLRAVVDQKWRELVAKRPEPKIFWGFIEFERNRFLKDYEHGITRELVVPGPEFNGNETTIHVDVGNSRGGEVDPGRELQSVLSSGPFAGQRERAVAWQAYDWWVDYLNEVDRLANPTPNPVKGTATSGLRPLASAPYVER